MERPETCPECGSSDLREETRKGLDTYTDVQVIVCGACHWASDPRVGRPPADRGKNVTLRRLMKDAHEDASPDHDRQ